MLLEFGFDKSRATGVSIMGNALGERISGLQPVGQPSMGLLSMQAFPAGQGDPGVQMVFCRKDQGRCEPQRWVRIRSHARNTNEGQVPA